LAPPFLKVDFYIFALLFLKVEYMVDLCKYKDALGKPGKGVHSYRFMGVAIADVIMTLIGAFIISYFSGYSFLMVAAILFILGIILHRLFCVRTTIDKILFPNAN
jgi:hypothetical protein